MTFYVKFTFVLNLQTICVKITHAKSDIRFYNMTEYVLIYDNSGVFDASRDDLKTLFELYGIYSDVTV